MSATEVEMGLQKRYFPQGLGSNFLYGTGRRYLDIESLTRGVPPLSVMHVRKVPGWALAVGYPSSDFHLVPENMGDYNVRFLSYKDSTNALRFITSHVPSLLPRPTAQYTDAINAGAALGIFRHSVNGEGSLCAVVFWRRRGIKEVLEFFGAATAKEMSFLLVPLCQVAISFHAARASRSENQVRRLYCYAGAYSTTLRREILRTAFHAAGLEIFDPEKTKVIDEIVDCQIEAERLVREDVSKHSPGKSHRVLFGTFRGIEHACFEVAQIFTSGIALPKGMKLTGTLDVNTSSFGNHAALLEYIADIADGNCAVPVLSKSVE